MNLKPLSIVARKELADGLRDRRSLYTVLLVSLFGPMLISFMLKQLAGQKKAAEEIRLPVVGRENAPLLVHWLEQQSGVEVVPGPSDAEAAVRDRREELVLVIKPDFRSNFEQSKPAAVQLFSDSTRKAVQPKLTRATSLLHQFNNEMAALRLIARGISPEAVSPLKISDIDLANSQQRGAIVLNVILMFMAVAALTAGLQIASDSTAGERERGSLEPLLLNPVPRWQMIAGKWAASVVMAFGGMIVSLLVMKYAISRLPLEDLGVRFHLGRPAMLMLLAVMSPLAILVPAIQTWMSCFAKSFKEAQSYNSILVIPVGFLGVVTMTIPMTSHAWILAVPVLSQYALGSEILAGKAVSSILMIGTGIECAAIAVIFLWLAARLFTTERIIFGR